MKKKCKCEEELNEECTCGCECHENEELNKIQEELANEKAKSLRIQAEMVNFKRRKEEELSNFLKYANEELIIDLLPTVDNFERALKTEISEEASDEVKKYQEGFKMIYGNLLSVLKQIGVEEIESSGVSFDPNYHEAVLTEKDESKPSGVILDVLQKGYKYKDKVIRPAMVKVNE